jgi:uncharacterized protein YndB with AHSA1/START domain
MSESLVFEAVRKTVTVDRTVEEAFRVFTAEALSWWPVETHSINVEVDEIVFEPEVGGAVYEIGANGERGHWATVLEWEPPHRLVLAWNILERAGDLTEVEVQFFPENGATRVELEHRGWENVAVDSPSKRAGYETGWDVVLGKYADRTAR